jgi:hypothetical protein
MEVHSLTILHYGKDYLSYALRSVYDQVEQCHIFYTPTPSHGHATNAPPIETREELLQAAYQYDPDDKVKWYDMHNVINEGVQRDLALEYVKRAGAELVLVVDCDEVWPDKFLRDCLQKVEQANLARNWLVNMIHFWRSFNWVCRDQGWPVRIIDLRHDTGIQYLNTGVYHFGYAMTSRIMQYKWQIHGHKNELRPNWFQDKWYRWPPPEDCHPTNEANFWMPRLFDKLKLPDFMRDHHFWGVDKIE